MSLRTRLLAAVGAVALAALLVSDVGTYSALRSFLLHRADAALQAARGPIEHAAGTNRCPTASQVSFLARGLFVELRDQQGHVICSAGASLGGNNFTVPALPTRIVVPASGTSQPRRVSPFAPGRDGFRRPGRAATFFTVRSVRPASIHFRVAASTLRGSDQLILALPIDQLYATLRRLVAIETALTFTALGASIGLGWWLVRAGLRPLAQVQGTAAAIASGGLGERVPGATPKTEIGRLAQTLNVMLGRLEDTSAQRDQTERELRVSQEHLRRFVADASHELRTPLAAVAAYAELFERGAQDNPNDLVRVMSGIRSETARMSKLVQDLLILARLDEGVPIERAPVELVSIAAQAVDTAIAVAPRWPVGLIASHPIELVADKDRLRQVLDNLLSNVRAHTPPGTPAVVRLTSTTAHAVIEVSDRGPGMHGDTVEKAFERFYREDPSRSRASGGAGLGLAIVAAIVSSHGGDVSTSATPGGGATFTVRLPL